MTRRLLALGTVELVLLGVLGWLPAAHRFPWPGLLLFGAAFVVWALAGRTLHRAATHHGPSTERADNPTRTIWLLAVGMRLVLLPLAPELSDDFYRYFWDGHVQLEGINPYVHAPASEELASIRTPDHHLVNNPTVPTIYPPLAQVAFLLVALTGSSLLLMKLLWLAADLATAWVLTRIARDTGRDPALVLLLYAWAPLLLVEVAWNAHLEPLGLLPLAGAIWVAVRWRAATRPEITARRDGELFEPAHRYAALAGSLLAASALVKLAPAAAVPALVPRGRGLPPERTRPTAVALAAFAGTIVLFYLPYASAGPALFTGLRTYGEHWWFMKGPFALIERVTDDPLSARRVVGALVAGTIGITWVRRFDLERSLLWILGAGMVLTPTLHPWYVLWMLPMAALRTSVPWLALSGLAFIGYFGLGAWQEGGEWLQPPVARAALWIPFLVLLAREARRSSRREASP